MTIAVQKAVAETNTAAERTRLEAVEAAANSVGQHWAKVHTEGLATAEKRAAAVQKAAVDAAVQEERAAAAQRAKKELHRQLAASHIKACESQEAAVEATRLVAIEQTATKRRARVQARPRRA